MSVLPTATYYGPNNPIFAILPISVATLAVSSLSAHKINADIINANSTNTISLTSLFDSTSNLSVSNNITLNTNQVLTANSTNLLLNGVPVITTSTLTSTISNWSLYPQISTLQGNNQNIRGTNLLEAKLVNTSTLTGSNGTFINLFTQNLMAFNVVTFTSTFIDVYESTIQADIKLANISTLNAGNASISSANISTLNNIYANINTLTANATTVSTLLVNSNTATDTLTVNGYANLLGGFQTNGANNFNNKNLDNVGRITANTVFVGSPNYINTQTSSYTKILNDRGADVGGSSVVELTAQYGQSTRINLTAGQSSAYSPTPTQIITLTANGATSLTQNAVGGRVSIVANAGSGSGCNILGYGQIDLTAYSSLPFAGLIKESAGSILAYSGLTTPSVGVFGASFYSALTTLSLTCGATPATTSFPGVVYLRGDNGTKVVNGFFVDTINNNALSDLNIQSKTADVSNRNINIDSAFDLKLTSSNGGQVYINGSAYPPSSGSGVWCSTATTRLNMAGFDISNIGNLYSAGNFNIYAPAGLGVGFNNNVYFNTYNLNDIGGITMSSGGNINLLGGNLSNVGNIFGSNLTVSTGGNLTLKSSTGGNVIISNNVNVNSNRISNVCNIAFLSGDINTGSNYTDIHGGGAGTYLSLINGGSYYTIDTTGNTLISSSNVAGITASNTVFLRSSNDIQISNSAGASESFNADGSIYLQTTGANKTIYANIEAMTFTGGSNNRITDLGHIYGNTSANSGYGLNIDYAFGIFFNTTGRNANLYCDAYALNMTNYNTGIGIGCYNPTGTGVLSIYSASNDIYLSTGPNNDINLNAGRNVNLNGAQSGGSVGIYTSTINAQSLLDYNNYCGGNYNLTGGGASQYITFTNAGTTLQWAGPNLYFTTATGGTNFNTPVAIGSAYSLNMNTAPIASCGAFSRRLIGTDVAQPIIQYSTATGTGNNGTITVNLPQRYTSQTSYIPFANMMDDPPAQIFVSSISRGSFIIGWSSGGPGTHTFGWNTMGT